MSRVAPYPIFLNLSDQPVLIVGGGNVALRKARRAHEAGARVTAVSPEFIPQWRGLARQIHLIHETYRSGAKSHVAGSAWRLVFAATDVTEVNEAVARDAAAAGIWCCRCDLPQAGDFANGAEWHQDGLALAVSTAGSSPALAVRLRDVIATKMDPIYVQWCQLLAEWRPQVLRKVRSEAGRRMLLRQAASEEMEGTLRGGGRKAAQSEFMRLLAEAVKKST